MYSLYSIYMHIQSVRTYMSRKERATMLVLRIAVFEILQLQNFDILKFFKMSFFTLKVRRFFSLFREKFGIRVEM